jgi:hypothetical protein
MNNYILKYFLLKNIKKNRIAYVGMLRGLYLMPKTQKAWKAHISCQGPKKQVAKIMQRLRGNGWRVGYILSLYSMDVFGVIHLSCGYSIYNNIIFH